MRFAMRKAKNKIYLLTTRNIRREQPVQWRGRLLVIAGLLRAIAISRRRDHTPKVRSGTSIPRTCALRLGHRGSEVRTLVASVVPSLGSGKCDRAVKYGFFRCFNSFAWECDVATVARAFLPVRLRFEMAQTPPRLGSISTHVSMFRNCQPTPVAVRTIVINFGGKPPAKRSNNTTPGKIRCAPAIAMVAPPNAETAIMKELKIRGKINAPITPPPISIAVPKTPPITRSAPNRYITERVMSTPPDRPTRTRRYGSSVYVAPKRITAPIRPKIHANRPTSLVSHRPSSKPISKPNKP